MDPRNINKEYSALSTVFLRNNIPGITIFIYRDTIYREIYQVYFSHPSYDIRPSLFLSLLLILRGAIVNRTYGTHKNLYTSLFLLPIFGPIYYGPP